MFAFLACFDIGCHQQYITTPSHLYLPRRHMALTPMSHLLRNIPNVHECLTALLDSEQLGHVPLHRLKHCTRLFLEQLRSSILAGNYREGEGIGKIDCIPDLIGFILKYHQPRLTNLINATGVIIHTNLGRSVLPSAALSSIGSVGGSYSNLEFNLTTGKRGSRYDHVDDLLCELTGAEAALVVNNNAAAVLLCLETLAKDREVIVSRGQLVEIGGSFRIPDIMDRSGARLVEVGATNRTHLRDYENAISATTALLLKVHCSNFRIIGFTSEVSGADLVRLGKEKALPVMEDLGSGCLVDLTRFGLVKEPTVQEVVRSGVDIVTFSGDKLLGGPQAGLIVGKRQYIDRIRSNPLNRALRIDKFTLAGLESVLRLYLDESIALREIPTLAMLAESAGKVEERARNFTQRVSSLFGKTCSAEIVPVSSRVGGGAMPEQNVASWAVALQPRDITVAQMEKRLRHTQPPVIGRVENDRLLLDLRTVALNELDLLAASLQQALAETE